MRLIACSDLHFVDTNPKRRVDNYSEVLFDKWYYLLNYAIDHNIDMIAIAGDVFDTHRASNQLIAKLIKSINSFYVPDDDIILSVLGQHDLAFRSEHNSPMKILDTANIIKVIAATRFLISGRPEKAIAFYGCNWGEEIPQTAFKRGAHFNILLIHKMISNKDYWHGNLQYTEALSFLKEQEDYDLIISGDNHNTFCVEYENRLLINPGSLGRRNIDQVDHKPCFFVYDTETRVYSQVFIPIRPAEEVFNLDAIENEKARDENIEKFVSSLPEYQIHSHSEYVDYISRTLEKIKSLPEDYDPEIIEIIYECLDGLKTSQEE